MCNLWGHHAMIKMTKSLTSSCQISAIIIKKSILKQFKVIIWISIKYRLYCYKFNQYGCTLTLCSNSRAWQTWSTTLNISQYPKSKWLFFEFCTFKSSALCVSNVQNKGTSNEISKIRGPSLQDFGDIMLLIFHAVHCKIYCVGHSYWCNRFIK